MTRSRWVWAVLASIGLLALIGITLAALDDAPQAAPGPSAAPSTPAEQQTLLVQVRNDDDLAADNVIAGVGAGLPAVQVLVPSRLVVDTPGSAPRTLAMTGRGLDRAASQNALRDLLALRIDGTLSLGRLALAGMVDFVGGITVDVDTTITTIDEPTGQKVVVVPAGTQHLDGTQAAAFALAWLPGEPETARLHRWSAVLTATVAALPEDPLRIEQMLTSLGGSASTTVSTSQAAAFLLRLRAGILAGTQQVDVLPTLGDVGPTATPSNGATSDGSGSPTAPPAASPSADTSPAGKPAPPTASASASTTAPELSLVRVNLPASQELLERVLPTALLDPGEARPRVLVQDGVGEPGLSVAASADVARAGYVAIDGGNAAELGQELTRIVVGTGTSAAQLGTDVAEALDVPLTQVEATADPAQGADALVVLGSDFEP